MKRVSFLIALCLSTTFAQTTAPRTPYILAVGSASMSVKPDQVRVDIGVVTQAVSAQDASTQNATQVTAVTAQLRQVLGAAADIKTVNYTLSPITTIRRAEARERCSAIPRRTSSRSRPRICRRSEK